MRRTIIVSMPATEAALYLPISIGMLKAVLDEDEPLDRALSNLQVPQIACLIVIQYLPTIDGKRSPERMLADTIDIGERRSQQAGPQAFAKDAFQILEREKIVAGSERLSDFKILLLTDDDIKHRTYLTADRKWDHTFCERHRAQLVRPLQRIELPTGGQGILTLQQTQVFDGVRNNIDEHLHVQGYAGTGKSFLIRSLISLLQEKRANTLLLAEHQRQLDALLAGTRGLERVYPKTFGALMLEMIPYDLTDPASVRLLGKYPAQPTPDEELVRHLGVHPNGQYSAMQIVQAVRDTVREFCVSNDKEIEWRHLRTNMMDDDTTRQVILHHATELWKAVLRPPSREFQPRIRDHHRVKWAALNGLTVPTRYTHIVIDECHDVADSMLQILDRSSQPTFSLGDEYQKLEGEAHARSVPLRHKIVTNSVRAGESIEDIVNSIIKVHPGRTKFEFHGNPLTTTEVFHYDGLEPPDEPTTILVSDMWGLFEWAQRLARKCDFQLLSDPNNLKVFVTDLVELYRNKSRPRHRELFRFATWDALANYHEKRRGFKRIDAMLRKGFSLKDWANTSARFFGKSTSGYALGLISDVRNREFESVMLAPDVIDWARQASKEQEPEVASAFYVAVTRAGRELLLPELIESWIAEVRVPSVASRTASK